MSRTDKHRPIWVQIQDPDNRGFLSEHHDHTNGECDLHKWKDRPVRGVFWDRSWDMRCYYLESCYGYHAGIFPRQPRRGSRISLHRRARAQWRAERTKLLRGRDFDYSKPRAREYNSWMWEKWNW